MYNLAIFEVFYSIYIDGTRKVNIKVLKASIRFNVEIFIKAFVSSLSTSAVDA